jgi:hypothetical protein
MEPHSFSRNVRNAVIPTNVGIQQAEKKRCEASSKIKTTKTVALRATFWIPAFAGMTADIGVLFNACGFVLRTTFFVPFVPLVVKTTLAFHATRIRLFEKPKEQQ